jgi:phage terminase small subunit
VVSTGQCKKILGSNDKEAALAAGYSPSVAENTKQKIWAKPVGQIEFERLKERFYNAAMMSNLKQGRGDVTSEQHS